MDRHQKQFQTELKGLVESTINLPTDISSNPTETGPNTAHLSCLSWCMTLQLSYDASIACRDHKPVIAQLMATPSKEQ